MRPSSAAYPCRPWGRLVSAPSSPPPLRTRRPYRWRQHLCRTRRVSTRPRRRPPHLLRRRPHLLQRPRRARHAPRSASSTTLGSRNASPAPATSMRASSIAKSSTTGRRRTPRSSAGWPSTALSRVATSRFAEARREPCRAHREGQGAQRPERRPLRALAPAVHRGPLGNPFARRRVDEEHHGVRDAPCAARSEWPTSAFAWLCPLPQPIEPPGSPIASESSGPHARRGSDPS